MIFEQYANLKYKYSKRNFWCKGYYVSTVGRNKETIKKYIRDQQKKDILSDQINIERIRKSL